MKVKIVAHFADSEANYAHADLTKPLFADVREHIARQWAANGWAIIIPEPKEEKAESKPDMQAERAVIETPEDHSPAKERETAALRRKK